MSKVRSTIGDIESEPQSENIFLAIRRIDRMMGAICRNSRGSWRIRMGRYFYISNLRYSKSVVKIRKVGSEIRFRQVGGHVTPVYRR